MAVFKIEFKILRNFTYIHATILLHLTTTNLVTKPRQLERSTFSSDDYNLKLRRDVSRE